MTRAFNIEGLVRLQNYMGGKTLSDAQFFAVLNADVVEMIDGEESTTKRRYFRIAENDESITFSCILGSSQQQMVVTKATKQLDVTTTEIGGAIAPGSITTEMLADGAVTRGKIASQSIDSLKLANGSVSNRTLQMGAVTSEKLAPGLDVSGLFFIPPKGTQLPYTFTEEDKKKLANAHFIIIEENSGSHYTFLRRGDTYEGTWCQLGGPTTYARLSVSKTTMSAPATAGLVPAAITYNAQTLTAKQKAQARANIESADAGLFFILPEGTQFPYTLTEDDKTKLNAATVLILHTISGATPFQRGYREGLWCSLRYINTLWTVTVSERSISAPVSERIYDDLAVRFTDQTLTTAKKAQARANIGAAEDPNTSGDSPATLKESIL